MHTDIDLKRMRYVMEVARAGAISLAAEHLRLTQSALSRSIVECEAAIAAQLFVRVPKGIRLTEAGQRFVDRAQRVLAEVDSLVRHVQAPGELLGGRLRVGFAPGGFVDHGARALCDFAEQYPQVGIDVSQGTAQVLCPRLLGGELDVLVR